MLIVCLDLGSERSGTSSIMLDLSGGTLGEVVYRPSGSSKRASRTSQSTIHEVGARIGRKLRQSRVRYVGGHGGGTGRGERPRVRAAHWHHYWVGPRSEPERRRLVVRWLEPVFVGVGDADTVIHTA